MCIFDSIFNTSFLLGDFDWLYLCDYLSIYFCLMLACPFRNWFFLQKYQQNWTATSILRYISICSSEDTHQVLHVHLSTYSSKLSFCTGIKMAYYCCEVNCIYLQYKVKRRMSETYDHGKRWTDWALIFMEYR